MTHEKMPEVLRLADECDASALEFLNETNTRRAAAATIRRQHAEIQRLQAEVNGLRKDAALIDWLGSAPTGIIRVDFNPFNPTYINYSASGGDIRPALTKSMQSTKDHQ